MSRNKTQLMAAQNAAVRKRRRDRKKKRIAILVTEVIIFSLLAGAAFVMAKYDKFQTVTINKNDLGINDGIGQEGYTTVALFGGDSRDGQLEEGTHADTMIIAAIDNETREIRMASVYRDTLLKQKNGDYQKANYAYFSGGPGEALSMLNKNLDLDIEDYVTVDFKALVDSIDLLGGIDIDIKEEELKPLNKYIQETAKVAGTQANGFSEAGKQHLDGAQAVTYARIRSTAGGDYTRTERQRLVIEKLFEKVMKTNLSTVNKIVDKVFPQVSTSFTLKELLALASGMMKYELAENTGFPIDKTDGEFGTVGSIVIPIGLTENVVKLHEFLYPKETKYTPSSTVEEIAADITFQTGVSSDYTEGDAVQNTGDAGGSQDTEGTGSYTGDTGAADQYGGDTGGTDPYGGDAGAADPYGGDAGTADPYAGDTGMADPYGGDTGAADQYGGDTGGTDPYAGDTGGTETYTGDQTEQ